MPVVARLNNLRMAPRKVRLVANLVKGMNVNDAMSELEFLSKRSAKPLQKLLQTAAANAEHNFQLAKGDLIVQKIVVNAAPTLKRFMPRAFGRAGMIRKRGSNVIVTLESKTGALVEKTGSEKETGHHQHKSGGTAPTHRDTGSRGGAKGAAPTQKRRLFSRKTGSS